MIRLPADARGGYLLVRVTDAARNVATRVLHRAVAGEAPAPEGRPGAESVIIEAMQAGLRRLPALLVLAACRATHGAPPARGPDAAGRDPARPALDESLARARSARAGRSQRRLVGEPTTLNAVLQSSLPEAQVLAVRAAQSVRLRRPAEPRARASPSAWRSPPTAASTSSRCAPEAVWEDGRPVTSDDAVFTIRKIVDPDVPSPVFKPLFEGLESVEALDARRFRVRFREPYAFRAMAFVLPAASRAPVRGTELPEGPGQSRARSPTVRTGWSRGRPQESVELERNPRVLGAAAATSTGSSSASSPTTRRPTARLTAGESRRGPDRRDAEGAGGRPTRPSRRCCRLVEFYNLDYSYVALNNRSPVLLRRPRAPRADDALRPRLDRARTSTGAPRGSSPGRGRRIRRPTTRRFRRCRSTRAAAKALLDEAGWRDTNGERHARPRGAGVRVRAARSPAGSEIGRQIDEMLAAELARVGVTARVRPLEWAAFVERIDAGELRGRVARLVRRRTPTRTPTRTGIPRSGRPNGLNSGCYRNPEADRLMDEARRELDDVAPRRDLPPAPRDLSRRRSGDLRRERDAEVRACDRRVRGLTTSPLGLFGIWPGPARLVGRRVRADCGGPRRDPLRPPAARPGGADALRDRRVVVFLLRAPGPGKPRLRRGAESRAARPGAPPRRCAASTGSTGRCRSASAPGCGGSSRFDLGESLRRPAAGCGPDPGGPAVHAAPERARAPADPRDRDPARRRGRRPAGGRVRPRFGRGALRPLLDAVVLGGAAAADALRGAGCAGCRSTASPRTRRRRGSPGLAGPVWRTSPSRSSA